MSRTISRLDSKTKLFQPITKVENVNCSVMSLSLSEYLYGLVEALGLVIERDVANWIANQGGWVSVIFYLSLRLKSLVFSYFVGLKYFWLFTRQYVANWIAMFFLLKQDFFRFDIFVKILAPDPVFFYKSCFFGDGSKSDSSSGRIRINFSMVGSVQSQPGFATLI